MAVPRGWCLHGYRCGAEKKGTGVGGCGRETAEGGWEREKARTYLPTGVVDVLRIICVLRSLLHCALFSVPTAYYLLALTCNCIDLQYTTRPGPTHARWIFFLFSRMYPDLPGNGSLLRLAPRVMEQPLMLHFQHVTIFPLASSTTPAFNPLHI